jgi:hypothetical protein
MGLAAYPQVAERFLGATRDLIEARLLDWHKT